MESLGIRFPNLAVLCVRITKSFEVQAPPPPQVLIYLVRDADQHLYIFKIPQVIPMCDQDGETLILGWVSQP